MHTRLQWQNKFPRSLIIKIKAAQHIAAHWRHQALTALIDRHTVPVSLYLLRPALYPRTEYSLGHRLDVAFKVTLKVVISLYLTFLFLPERLYVKFDYRLDAMKVGFIVVSLYLFRPALSSGTEDKVIDQIFQFKVKVSVVVALSHFSVRA